MAFPDEPEPVRPWSPYPVQDWSTLPDDPLGGDGVRYTGVDDGWAPPGPYERQPSPQKRPPSWLPLVVILVVLALISVGIYAANLVGTQPAGSGAARFAPADGVVDLRGKVASTTGSSVSTSVITEQARYLGVPGLQSVDWKVGVAVLGVVGERLDAVQFWRSLSTTIGSTAGTGQTSTLREVGREISLLAETGPTTSYVYSPGLVELPADVAPGSTWSSTGTAGEGLGYASSFSAEAAGRDCLQINGTITYAHTGGATVRQLTVDRTWCSGAGIVAERSVEAGTATTLVPRPDVTPSPPPTAEARYAWSPPSGWQRRDFAAITIDPTYGEGIVGGTPSPVPPAITSSGILFRVNQQARDIVGFVPKTAGTWRQAVRMHPGGTILTLAAFGRLVVATTSERQVVAYDDQGARLWAFGSSELVLSTPVRVDEGAAALVSIGGEVVVLDLASGDPRWQRRAGADVAMPLAVGDGVVAVLDRSGNATAFEAADGRQRWQIELQASGAAIDDGLLVAISDQSLEGVDLASGQRRWIRPFRGSFQRISAFAKRFVVQNKLSTLAVEHDGTTRPVGPAYLSSMQTVDYFFGWADGHTDVLDARLTKVAGWPSAEETLGGFASRGLPYAQGIIVVTGKDWDIQTYSDEP